MDKDIEAFHKEGNINDPLIQEKVVDFINNQGNANQKLQRNFILSPPHQQISIHLLEQSAGEDVVDQWELSQTGGGA